MILNLTSTPFESFSAVQRLATNGKRVVDKRVSTIEEFYDAYDPVANDCEVVIVDETDVVLDNDIVNAALCPVVTLRVEIDCEKHTHKFLVYE
jgi:hypothetical protein